MSETMINNNEYMKQWMVMSDGWIVTDCTSD